MTCAQIQRRLLGTENPAQPAPEVEAHLAECPACREWQRRLLLLEANVPRVPVPPSGARQEFLDRFLNPEVAPAPVPPIVPRARPRSRGRLIAAIALAASVLIACGILLGNWLWEAVRPRASEQARVNPRPAPARPADPLLARLVQCDLNLARARGVQERLRLLAELADSLQGETALLVQAAGNGDLDHLAGLYARVVRQGLLPRSRALPAPERRRVLGPIADQLARASREAEQLAKARPGAAGPLRRLAEAAREGEVELRHLMENKV